MCENRKQGIRPMRLLEFINMTELTTDSMITWAAGDDSHSLLVD